MTTSTHDTKVRKLALLGLCAAVAAGLVLGLLVPAHSESTPVWIVLPALLLLMAVVVVAGLPWWHALDDVQKQGQTHSWYWGSMLGALAFICWLIATTGRHSDLSLGAGYLFIAQGAGFVIAWAVWRIRGRGAKE